MGNLQATNSRTVLGAVWWVLNPMLLAGVYFLVFGVIFAGGRRGDPAYLTYLMSGMFPFHFTSRALTGGAQSITSNGKLLVNLKFPRLLLPISGMIESSVGFLTSILVFFILAIPVAGVNPGAQIFLLVIILPAHMLMTLGLSGLAARYTVPFRDLGNLIPYVTRLWLYLSPIIWTPDQVADGPAWVQRVVEVNPMYVLLAVYRAAMTGAPISNSEIAAALAWCAAFAAIGIIVFIRNESKMVRYL